MKGHRKTAGGASGAGLILAILQVGGLSDAVLIAAMGAVVLIYAAFIYANAREHHAKSKEPEQSVPPDVPDAAQ